MLKIQELADNIKDELKDADKYIGLALKYKDSDKTTADMYYQKSLEEMEHANTLHKRITELIAEYRKANGEPPPEMIWRYDYLHKIHIENATEIKVKQMIYKEGLK